MTCPICEKASDSSYRALCCRRCADVDLGKWLNGTYAVPSHDGDDAGQLAQALREAEDKPH